MKSLLIRTVVSFCFMLIVPLNVSAVFITDINRSTAASGGVQPAPGPSGSVVIDNDFRIRNWESNTGPVGDGINDETTWVFHYAENNNERAAYTAFENELQTGGTLVQADIWLQLTPMDSLISTDEIELIGLGTIGQDQTDAFANLTVGTLQTVHLNLFDFFSVADVTSYILGRRGIYGASFRDDAIMYTAKMDLRSVPEPASLLLLGVGLLALSGLRRSRT